MANALTDTDITGTLDISGQVTIGGGSGDTGATHGANGDITTDGDITAASFIGDGSNLTNVPAGGPTFLDNVFRVQDNGDATKQIAFQASGVSAGQTRTITMPDADVNLGAIATNTAKVSNATHTGHVTGATALTIANGVVTPAMHSATGTADATTYLRGDGTWTAPSGSGDMVLASTQTVTGAKTFEDATLILEGLTSGTTTLKAAATAGTTTITMPAATGTMALTSDIPADTDSLSEGSTNLYKTAAEATKLGHITVTSAINLDTLSSSNHAEATISGTPDYITLTDQDFELGQIDLATDVTGELPTANIADDAVDADKLAADAVVTGSIVDEAVTNAKLAHMAQSTIKGRAASAGTGDATDLTPTQARTVLRGATTEASNATPSVNCDNVAYHTITALAADMTSFTVTGTPVEGQTLWIAITGTATRSLTFGASFEDSTIPLPTTTDSTTRIDIGVVYNSTSSKWRCVAVA